MKPAWDALMKEFDGSKNSGVYDVDCTADGKELCEEVGVSGYPTIKWGDPSDKKALQDYSGGREEADLKKFAAESLGPTCGPDHLDVCTDEQRTQLEGFLKRTASDLEDEVKRLEKLSAESQKKVDKKTVKLKEKRQEFEDDRDEQRGQKPKKGKEKEFEAKKEKMKARNDKLHADGEALEAEGAQIVKAMEESGLALMKLAAKANKAKTEL